MFQTKKTNKNKYVYPVIFSKDKDGYLVTIPDLDLDTEGKDFSDAINIARDAISLYILDKEDNDESIPEPHSVRHDLKGNDFIFYIDVDMILYRKKYGTKTVKKNCTIPAWLDAKARELDINFSKTLQEALLKKIG